MRVKDLTISNFRGIEELSLDFSGSRVLVLVGINGSGKSTVLECLSILLSESTEPFHKRAKSVLGGLDIKSGHNECRIEATVNFNEQDYRLSLYVTRDRWDFTEDNLKGEMLGNLEINPGAGLSIAVYYTVNRYVIDVPVGVPEKPAFPQARAYEDALSGDRLDFTAFFEWFRNREDIENENRIHDSSYRDRQLQAVRRAIERMVPGFSNPRVRRAPARMVIDKTNEMTGRQTELLVNQMSDGEKCMLAMVGDLARRLAIANPEFEDPLHGDGVVLIDEIDLHLHPSWQREVIPALARTFPECQFIASTHSPQVLSNVKPEDIYLLEATDAGIVAHRPTSSYGRDTNRILEDLMGVPERPQHIKEDLHRYFRLIDDGKKKEAKRLRKKLEKEIGADEPEFARADVLIRRKEILGR